MGGGDILIYENHCPADFTGATSAESCSGFHSNMCFWVDQMSIQNLYLQILQTSLEDLIKLTNNFEQYFDRKYLGDICT